MLESIGSIFSRPHKKASEESGSRCDIEEGDVKYLIQDWLRTHLKSEAIYCDGAESGVVVVRVGSPSLAQAAQLAEYDLREYAEGECNYLVEDLVVKVGN